MIAAAQLTPDDARSAIALATELIDTAENSGRISARSDNGTSGQRNRRLAARTVA
jgi:hypothetical protein